MKMMNFNATLVRLVSIGLLCVVACRGPRQNPIGQDAGRDANLTGGGGTGGSGAGGAISGGTGGAGGRGGETATGGVTQIDGGIAQDASLDLPVGPDGAVACASDQKRCSGSCVAKSDPTYGCDSTTCDTSACPTVAGATLVCQGSLCVVGTCGAATKKCGVRCVDVNDPTYGCGASTCDASTCPSPGVGGSVICQGGACVIGTCAPGTKKCGTRCVVVGDPTYGCGAATCDALACPVAGTGTLICQGGACVIGTCGAGTKKCGDKCVPTDANNGCGDATRCTPCASNESCVGTPVTQCQCVPNSVMVTCAGKACGNATNNCGQVIPCPNTCTGVNTCNGGNAGPNGCGCTPNNMAACTGKACGPATNNCGQVIPCTDTCTGVNTCNGGTAGPNGCGCTPNNMAACTGKACGNATNNCGQVIPCTNTCTGVNTCNGGTAGPNGCGCTPNNTAACAGKQCGNATNNCGQVVPCTPMCPTPPPETVTVCLVNACSVGCGSDTTPLTCSTSAAPACGRWKLDATGSERDWSIVPLAVVPGNNVANAAVGAPFLSASGLDRSGQGRALGVRFQIATPNTGWIQIRVPLCPRGLEAGEFMTGKHISVNVRVTLDGGTAQSERFLQMYPVNDLSTTPTTGTRVAFKDGSAEFPFGPSSWVTLDGFVSAADTAYMTAIYVVVTFAGDMTGTVYVDDLYVR